MEDSKKDFDCTVFIGNLPWIVNEEEVRAHFATCGKILNVRLIRDKERFIGKGIGYVQYATKEEMRKAVETKNKSIFKGRELRVKKAVEPKRLEKKEKKRRETKELMKNQKRENRRDKDGKPISSKTNDDGNGGDSNDDIDDDNGAQRIK